MNRLNPIAIKNTTPYVVSTPRGIDMVCKSLQSKFAELEWNEKSFARAIFMSREQDGREYVFPAVFTNEGDDYLDLMMLDNWAAYSFMYARDSEKIETFEEYQNVLERKLSVVFWMNLNQIDSSRKDDFLEELKQDVIKAIKTTRFTDTTNGASVMGVELEEIFDEPKNVFKDFTLSLKDTQSLYYPYRGIRIDLKCYYTEDC